MPPIEFLADGSDGGKTVAQMLRQRFRLTWARAQRLVERGHVRIAGMACADPAQRIRRGNRVWIREGVFEMKKVSLPKPGEAAAPASPSKPKQPAAKPAKPQAARAPKPDVSIPTGLVLVYADDQVVVVDKPAGLTTSRSAEDKAEFGRRAQAYLPTTLADLVPKLLGEANARVIAVHRLDRDTTGLVAFARTPSAATHLSKQFKAHTVERRYLALVRGTPKPGRVESVLIGDRGDGRRGSATTDERRADPDARRAATAVKLVEELGPLSLVECRLETGRTHQVRIHLGELGTPLAGERVYDRPVNGKPLPDPSGAARPMLHAASLGFTHPATGERLEWEAPLPADFAAIVGAMKAQG